MKESVDPEHLHPTEQIDMNIESVFSNFIYFYSIDQVIDLDRRKHHLSINLYGVYFIDGIP